MTFDNGSSGDGSVVCDVGASRVKQGVVRGFKLDSRILWRIAGASWEALEALRSVNVTELAQELRAAQLAESAKRAQLADILYSEIPHIDAAVRGRALALRRALFAGKTLSGIALEAVLPHLAATTALMLLDVHDSERTRLELEATLRRAFSCDLKAEREELQRRVTDHRFLQGIVLSSDALFANVSRYTRAKADALSGKDEQVERGLLRYLSRMASKCTPFGQFCAIGMGQVVSVNRQRVVLDGSPDPLEISTQLRINRALLFALFDRCFAIDSFKRNISFRLNSTIECLSDEYRFLAAAGQVEAFRRVKRNGAIDVVFALLSRLGVRPHSELVEALAASPELEVDEGSCRAYIDGLIQLGFLQLQFDIAPDDAEWHKAFSTLLRKTDSEEARAIDQGLLQLVELRDLASEASAFDRRELLAQFRAKIDELLGGRIGAYPVLVRTPIYEDAAVTVPTCLESDADVTSAFERLGEIIRYSAGLSWPVDAQAAMRHYFDIKYGTSPVDVPLLDFYEDYFRDHLKEHLAKESPNRSAEADGYDLGNPFGLEAVAQRRSARVMLSRLLHERWRSAPDAKEIHITCADLDPLLASFVPADGSGDSIAVFCQIAPPTSEQSRYRIIAPGARSSLGFGKYTSRFLHLFPEQVTEDARTAILDSDTTFYAEIADDAKFNANIHPPLAATEIRYPTRSSCATTRRELNPSRIVVRKATADEQLVLIDADSGRRVVPLDLGFQNPRVRPGLFQLLCRFQPRGGTMLPVEFGHEVLEQQIRNAEGNGGATTIDAQRGWSVMPRVVYEDRVVLSRRKWVFSARALPVRERAEAGWAYFARVQAWREMVGLPHEVFARVVAPRFPKPAPNVNSDDVKVSGERARAEPIPDHVDHRARKDAYKPQYVNFDSTLFVELFGKVVGDAARSYLILEECLPSASQSPTFGDEHHAGELLVHFRSEEESVLA